VAETRHVSHLGTNKQTDGRRSYVDGGMEAFIAYMVNTIGASPPLREQLGICDIARGIAFRRLLMLDN
jgi:hypothetical protein